MKQPTQIFKSTVHSYSDVYGSRQKAEYAIGRPDGARAACFNLSKQEVQEILDHLPEEFERKSLDSGQLEKYMNMHDDQEESQEKPFDNLTVKELKEEAKKREVKGYSDMNKTELKKEIEKAELKEALKSVAEEDEE